VCAIRSAVSGSYGDEVRLFGPYLTIILRVILVRILVYIILFIIFKVSVASAGDTMIPCPGCVEVTLSRIVQSYMIACLAEKKVQSKDVYH